MLGLLVVVPARKDSPSVAVSTAWSPASDGLWMIAKTLTALNGQEILASHEVSFRAIENSVAAQV